jgi:mannose-6-phosphate isomerase-like protein (cupin superfamily)
MKEIAAATDLTESFISQVERDAVNPSVASLQRIAGALGVHLSHLFDDSSGAGGRVVRSKARARLIYPGLASSDALLSPDLQGKLEVLWAEADPGGGSGDQPYTHPGDEECVVVIRGTMEIHVGDERYILKAGDAVTFGSRSPHRWKNIGRGRLQAIWAMTPPSY